MSDRPIERTRTIRWEDPLATAARVREMSGLEFLEAIRTGAIPSAGHSGRKLATAEGRIVVYATGTTSCMIFES